MAFFRVPFRRAEVDACFSTPLLTINPLLNIGNSESPVFSDAKASDLLPSGHLLKRLRVNSHHRCGLIGIQQWRWNKGEKRSGDRSRALS